MTTRSLRIYDIELDQPEHAHAAFYSLQTFHTKPYFYTEVLSVGSVSAGIKQGLILSSIYHSRQTLRGFCQRNLIHWSACFLKKRIFKTFATPVKVIQSSCKKLSDHSLEPLSLLLVISTKLAPLTGLVITVIRM